MDSTSSIILFVFIIIHISHSALTGYECGRNYKKSTSISTLEIGNCNFDNSHPNVSTNLIQLLQISNKQETQASACKITIFRKIANCGQFKYGNQILDNINKQQINRRIINIVGKVNDKGECQGSPYKFENRDYSNVIVIDTLEIRISGKMASVRKVLDKITIDNGLSCTYSTGSCVDEDYTYYFWNFIPRTPCRHDEFVVLLEGQGTKVTNSKEILYFGNSSNNIQFGLELRNSLVLCGFTLWKTEHPKLYIYEKLSNNEFASKRALNFHDILQDAYFNTKISYLSRHVKTQFVSLYQDILLNKCLIEKQIMATAMALIHHQPDLFALTIMKSMGYMAHTAGEAAFIIKCTELQCKIRKTQNCYEDLPVMCNNISFFLKPRTRVLIKSSVQRECNPLLPTYFYIDNFGHKFPSTSVNIKEPQVISPTTNPTWHYEEIRNIITSELYSVDDMYKAQNHILFPVEHQAYTHEIAKKLSNQAHLDSIRNYANLLDEAYIENKSKS